MSTPENSCHYQNKTLYLTGSGHGITRDIIIFTVNSQKLGHGHRVTLSDFLEETNGA